MEDGLERRALDSDNGLPLIPNLDKLFDKGFVSFEDDGTVIVSPILSAVACAAFGVNATTRLLKPLNAAQRTYMAHHRDRVFKKG